MHSYHVPGPELDSLHMFRIFTAIQWGTEIVIGFILHVKKQSERN